MLNTRWPRWLKRLGQLRLRQVDAAGLDERTLLINVYATQLFMLLLALLFLWWQGRNPLLLLPWTHPSTLLFWGAGLAALVLLADMLASRIAPNWASDGGINRLLFRDRPLWHIALLCFVVSVCEELLFRGAIQHALGLYWTSLLFAAIHFRYLRHWLATAFVFAVSYGLGWIYMRTGTLWTPIAAHFLIDFTMGCVIKYRREKE